MPSSALERIAGISLREKTSQASVLPRLFSTGIVLILGLNLYLWCKISKNSSLEG